MLVALLAAYSASALLVQKGQSCIKEDLAHRTAVQNKLAGVCVDMCKEIGAFPKCTCPDFVAPAEHKPAPDRGEDTPEGGLAVEN